MKMYYNNQNVTSKPLVSVCVFTYNHEGYIGQALEGILMQRTSFPYEIIVHDDASTDNTPKIIENYLSIAPTIIRPVFQKENKYSISRFNFQYEYVYPKALGKYIAICDGDDYWIDPLKLQMQIDFLESHPEYGLIHTKAAMYSEPKKTFVGVAGFEFNDFQELLTECSVAHSSVCFRRDLFEKYIHHIQPVIRSKWTTDDFPIWLWFILHSKIKLLPDITTVYRQLGESLSTIKDDSKRLLFAEGVYEIVDFYLREFPLTLNENKIRARYYSEMVKIYFLTCKWYGIRDSIKIFYRAKDWLNLLWIGMTLPFCYSNFVVKGSYRVRAIVFNLFNIYPIRS